MKNSSGESSSQLSCRVVGGIVVDTAQIGEGPIFRAITRWNQGQGECLAPASVNIVLAKRAAEAGIDDALDLASHSLRRGLATRAYRAGAKFQDFKRQHDGTVQGKREGLRTTQLEHCSGDDLS